MSRYMDDARLLKFKNWLQKLGAEILPNTNEYERIRFKGREVGVLYTSGKTSGSYADDAIACFNHGRLWQGGPVKTGRLKKYTKQKIALLERDGSDCFLCGLPLEDDMTLEHLIALNNAGS